MFLGQENHNFVSPPGFRRTIFHLSLASNNSKSVCKFTAQVHGAIARTIALICEQASVIQVHTEQIPKSIPCIQRGTQQDIPDFLLH